MIGFVLLVRAKRVLAEGARTVNGVHKASDLIQRDSLFFHLHNVNMRVDNHQGVLEVTGNPGKLETDVPINAELLTLERLAENSACTLYYICILAKEERSILLFVLYMNEQSRARRSGHS